jgi:LmbE family N-acetylglucosaminyl deacetylase
MKILVISAHPDDVEIACSGTLKKFQQQGADIISVITVKPSAEDRAGRDQLVVQSELEASYQQSGFDLRVLNTELHANGRPNLVRDNVTMSKLDQLLEPCDIAIIPNPEDSHQDHRTTYELAWPLVKSLAKEVWLMTSWPYCLTYRTNSANLFYDISTTWNFKQDLLETYSSYLTADKIEKIMETNRYFGQRNQQSIAEAFTIVNKYV